MYNDFTHIPCEPAISPFVPLTSHNSVSFTHCKPQTETTELVKGVMGLTPHIQGYRVGLQKGVRVWRVQQRAYFFPSGLSKGVAELLGQFLWCVNQCELFL